jgi:hypothetical protein
MPHFIKNGNTFQIADDNALDIHSKLPAGNYTVKKNDMTGQLYLEMIDSFPQIKKLYGDTTKNADRIINTFLNRDSSTGVLLNGEKGSGKTLLAKTLAIESAKQGIPCIVINSPWHGDVFNKFIQTINQPCMVLFDEFEKVYDKDDQESILTLLDGVFPSKKLFVLTCNDKWRIDSHMRNRPGRIYYMLDFKGLGADFITEYCEDNLINKHYIEKVVQLASLFGEFNFDMLKALVEEMNRYNESPADAMRMLNAKPEFSDGNTFTVQVKVKGQVIEHASPSKWEGNPLGQRGIHVEYDLNPEDDQSDWSSYYFGHEQLHSVQAKDGKFVFVNDEGVQVTLTKEKPKYFNYDAF